LNNRQVAEVLVANQGGSAESERLPIYKSLWVGVAESARGAVATQPIETTVPGESPTESTLPRQPTIDDFVQHVLTGEMQVWQFAAEPVSRGKQNPFGVDMYALDRAEIIMVTASVAPSSVSSLLPSINVMIDSPFNDAAVTREAVVRLSYLGINIVLIREVEMAPSQETVFEFNDRDLRRDLETYATVLGPLKLERVNQRVEGVDARLVLGQNFVAFAESSPSDDLLTIPSSTVPEDLNREDMDGDGEVSEELQS
jgi:hypothetical protein